MSRRVLSSFFFFNDTATTEIYTLSLHDALPIFETDALERCRSVPSFRGLPGQLRGARHRKPRGNPNHEPSLAEDRKSTRLNSSHLVISYAVFCLKKKKVPHRHRARRTHY